MCCYGRPPVGAHNKTVARTSQGPVAAVRLIADLFIKHKIIPKGAIAWDNTGNNKAYQSRQVIFVLNPTSIYAHLADSDKELYKVTGLLPVPAWATCYALAVSTAVQLPLHIRPYPQLDK